MASKGIKMLIETIAKNLEEAEKFPQKLIYVGNKTFKQSGFSHHTTWDVVETQKPIHWQIITKNFSALRPVLRDSTGCSGLLQVAGR